MNAGFGGDLVFLYDVGVLMYLISNRHALQNRGDLSILLPKPNTQDPNRICVYKVSRIDSRSWWLELDFSIETNIPDSLPYGIRQQNKYTQLSAAFRQATDQLLPAIEANRPALYLFSSCNADPKETLERAESVEKAYAVTAIAFSCPIKHRQD